MNLEFSKLYSSQMSEYIELGLLSNSREKNCLVFQILQIKFHITVLLTCLNHNQSQTIWD